MESRIPFTLVLIPFEFIVYFASLCIYTENNNNNKQILGKNSLLSSYLYLLLFLIYLFLILFAAMKFFSRQRLNWK